MKKSLESVRLKDTQMYSWDELFVSKAKLCEKKKKGSLESVALFQPGDLCPLPPFLSQLGVIHCSNLRLFLSLSLTCMRVALSVAATSKPRPGYVACVVRWGLQGGVELRNACTEERQSVKCFFRLKRLAN